MTSSFPPKVQALGVASSPHVLRDSAPQQLLSNFLHGVSIWTKIYIPGTQMTPVLIGKGFLLEGSSPKIEDKHVPGIYIYLSLSLSLSLSIRHWQISVRPLGVPGLARRFRRHPGWICKVGEDWRSTCWGACCNSQRQSSQKEFTDVGEWHQEPPPNQHHLPGKVGTSTRVSHRHGYMLQIGAIDLHLGRWDASGARGTA